jgi:hypothetical protein
MRFANSFALPEFSLDKTMKRVFSGLNLEYAASKDVWSIGFYIYCGTIAQVFSIFTHVGGPTKQLLLVEVLRLMFTCVNTVATLSFSRLFFAKPRTVAVGLTANLLVNALVGSLDNTAFGFMLGRLQLYNMVPIEQRFVSAFIMGPVLFMTFVSGFQGSQLRKGLQSKIAALRQELEYLAEYSGQLVQADLDEISTKVRKRLTPKISYVRNVMVEPNSSEDAVSLLNFMNQTDVRPAGQEVSILPQMPATLADVHIQVEKVRISAKYSLAESLSPILIALLSLIQYAVLILAARLNFSFASLLVFLLAAVELKVIQLVSDKNSEDRIAKILAKIFFILLLVLAGSSLILLYSGMHSPYTLMATLGSLVAATLIASVLSLTAQFNQQLTAELLNEQERLRASVSKVRQGQWFGRRRVVSQVHGNVQGAVVAAIARLSRHSDADQLDLARRDLDRAMDALRELPELSGDFETDLEMLESTWAGVCQIDFTISRDATDLISKRSANASVVHALVTEAVINAVRNGGATLTKISISSSQPGCLSLEIRDNGQIHQPVAIGSSARELLALTTKFSAKREGDFTVSTAEIPLADSLPADEEHL